MLNQWRRDKRLKKGKVTEGVISRATSQLLSSSCSLSVPSDAHLLPSIFPLFPVSPLAFTCPFSETATHCHVRHFSGYVRKPGGDKSWKTSPHREHTYSTSTFHRPVLMTTCVLPISSLQYAIKQPSSIFCPVQSSSVWQQLRRPPSQQGPIREPGFRVGREHCQCSRCDADVLFQTPQI